MENVLTAAQPILQTTASRWQALVQTLPDDLIYRRPAPGEWSAFECLAHLVDIEAVFQYRLLCFLEGKDLIAFDPDAQGTQGDRSGESPADLAARFAAMRSASLEKLEDVTPADLSRQVRHMELGPVTLSEFIHEWAAHDLNHTIQAEQAVMQPFIHGCGPWQTYFSAHFLSER